MSLIHKLTLSLNPRQTVKLPEKHKIIHAAVQYNQPTIWYEFEDTCKTMALTNIELIPTGQPIYNGHLIQHFGTFVLDNGNYVLHGYIERF